MEREREKKKTPSIGSLSSSSRKLNWVSGNSVEVSEVRIETPLPTASLLLPCICSARSCNQELDWTLNPPTLT